MLNELLFMETRIFSDYCKRNNLSAKEANRLFNQCDVWEYLESCYDTLHMNGDECVMDDVLNIINRKDAVA